MRKSRRTRLTRAGVALFSTLLTGLAGAATLQVGPERTLRTPSQAAALAKDGDTVEIDAANYRGDVAAWPQNRITLRGVGGRPHLIAAGANAEGKAIWVIKGRQVTVENIEFSGAQVPDNNGAGIRIEGADLTVRNCFFHNNQNGVLSGAMADSDIVIESSEFADNGAGDGRSHNIYIGAVRSLTLRYSYVHHARVGHNLKSRARTNYILYNRIMDERTGNASYAIDLPNGGVSILIGNLIQQGARAENSTLISDGAEGLEYPVNGFYFVNNTVVNDRSGGGTFFYVNPNITDAQLVNNLFIGKASVGAAHAKQSHNVFGSAKDVLSLQHYDYRLSKTSKAIAAGKEPGSAFGFSLEPTQQYLHPAGHQTRLRRRPLDAGAYAAHDWPR